MSIASNAGAADPADKAAPLVGTIDYGDDSQSAKVLFEVKFDGSVDPTAAVTNDPPKVTGPLAFEDGISGKALVVGEEGASLSYPVEGNLNASRGAVEFWIKPVDWDLNSPGFQVWFEPQNPGVFLVYKWQTQLRGMMDNTKEPSGKFVHAIPPGFEKGQWTHIVWSWEKGKGQLFVNGVSYGVCDVTAPELGKVFTIGDLPLWGAMRIPVRTLMDEFRIYDKPLQPGEVAERYNQVGGQQIVRAALTSHGAQGWAKLRLENCGAPGNLLTTIAAQPEGKIVYSAESFATGSEADVIFPTKQLAPGKYAITYRKLDINGGAQTRTLPLEVPAQPWRGNQIGKEDIVPPPFTPVQILAKSPLTLGVVGREITFADGPLPTRIESAGKELLSGPVRLVVNGQEVKGFELAAGEASQTAANVTGTAEAAGCKIAVTSRIEYDGLIFVDVQITGDKEAIKTVSLNIPMNSETAIFRVLPPWETNDQFTGMTQPWPKEQSTDKSLNRIGSAPGWKSSSPFVYNMWVGDDDRGLTFFCESPEGWNGDAARQIQLEQTGKSVVWTLNPVQEPWKEGSYRLQFGLHPTPMRPAPPRILGMAYGDDVQLAWGASPYSLYHGYPEAPADMRAIGLKDDDSIDALVAKAHQEKARVVSYLHISMLSKHSPEWKFFGEDWKIPGVQFNWVPDNFHVQHLDGKPKDWIYGVCPNSEWADFQIFKLHEYITKHDIDGIHFDFDAPWVCSNTNHGCRPGFMPIMAWREMHKRIYVMASQLPRPFTISEHTSINSGIMSSALLSFANAILEHENFSCWASDFGKADKSWPFTKVPMEYYRTRLSGSKFGLRTVPAWMQGYSFGSVAAISLLHDIPEIWGYADGAPKDWKGDWSRLYDALRDFGINDPGVEFLPYYKPSGEVTAGQALISIYRHPKNGLLAVIVNPSAEPMDAPLAFTKFADGNSVSVTDVLSKKKIPAADGRATVPVEPYNFALVHIEKLDATKAPTDNSTVPAPAATP